MSLSLVVHGFLGGGGGGTNTLGPATIIEGPVIIGSSSFSPRVVALYEGSTVEVPRILRSRGLIPKIIRG